MTEHGKESIIQDLIRKPFSTRSFSEKQEIVGRGRPCPPLTDLCTKIKDKKQEYVRHFQTTYYRKSIWLAGCDVSQRLFCWPCLLFGVDRTNVWTKDGFFNLNVLSLSTTRHEKSLQHIKASLELSTFGRTRIDLELNLQMKISVKLHNEAVKKNRNILKRLIDCVCFLAKQELPFRGHDESKDSINRGNYIELLQLISEYDSMLANHLKDSTIFRGTSPTIQNDLIQAISKVLINAVKKEIANSEFVSILLDETTDVITKSQLSTCLRYVNANGESRETFIGFSDVSADRSAEALCRHVVKTAQEFNFESKLVGQTYDGAAVMSGQITGLQKRVQDIYAQATFTHCYSHVLNLILQQSVCAIKECRIFFKTLTGISAFFSTSSKRSHSLKQFMEKKIPKAAPTRWNFCSRLVNTVHEMRNELVMFFEDIIENCEDWDVLCVTQAHGFVKFLTESKTRFFLQVFSVIFCHSDILFDTLQKKSVDIAYCDKEIARFQLQLKTQRNDFEEVWKKSNLRETDEFLTKRLCIDKGEIRRLYFEIIDNISNQISERFGSLGKLEFMALLNEERFSSYKLNFPETLLNKLNNSPYCKSFDFVKLKNELIALYSSPEFEKKPVHELVQYMNANNIHNIMSETYKLASLILTIPASTASVERSFSALRRINNYMRATQSQERLSALGILSIEKELLVKLKSLPTFYDEVITEFSIQTRRAEFTFK